MKFKIGDRVEFLNEVGGGVVKAYQGDLVLVEDEHGFDMPYKEDDLIFPKKWESNEPPSQSPSKKTVSDETDGYRIITGKRRFMEVDLHIHMVVDSTRNLSNHEMVLLQLKHFEKTFNEARQKRLGEVVYIHGIGKGRLKEELHKRLKALPNCSFSDADYSRYGFGATSVRMRYN